MPANTDTKHLDIAPEVADALHRGSAVVALESTIISHGMPHPRNVETALAVEATIRDGGAVPATIAIVKGRLKVGLSVDEIQYLGKKALAVTKTSRRDLPFVVAQRLDGSTTVAATMIIAAMANIRVFGTGGIGGVHRGVEDTMDVSADLEELAQTDVAVICSGAKSVLDIGRTLEYLETKGVPVVGFGTNAMPSFYSRDSGFSVNYRLDTAADVAKTIRTKWDLGLSGGVLIANPIPTQYAIDSQHMEDVIQAALPEMNDKGITGKDTTPFLLAKIAELTQGESLDANIQLVLNNAKLAAGIACALSEL